MSATLIARGLAAGHGNHVLFSGLDLVIAPGEVTGVVGANGAGKSTLLRLLAGVERGALEQGSIALSPATATVGYLPQEPDRRAGETVSAFIARRTGVARAQHELDEATEALAAGAPGSGDAYPAALDRWLNLGGADLEERAEKVMSTPITCESPAPWTSAAPVRGWKPRARRSTSELPAMPVRPSSAGPEPAQNGAGPSGPSARA